MKMKKLVSSLLALVLVFSVVAVNVTDTSYAASSTSVGQVKNLKYKKQYATYPTYNVTWNKVKNATGYQIYFKMQDDDTWNKAKVKGKTKYLLEFKLYNKETLQINCNYNAVVKVRAYRTANGRTTYGKFSKEKIIDISSGLQLYRNVQSAAYELKRKVNFPSTLQIQTVYGGIGTMTAAEQTNPTYTGRLKNVVYIEYTAKDTSNKDCRGYLRAVWYYIYGETDYAAVNSSPVTYELVDKINEKDAVNELDPPFLKVAKVYDGRYIEN